MSLSTLAITIRRFFGIVVLIDRSSTSAVACRTPIVDGQTTAEFMSMSKNEWKIGSFPVSWTHLRVRYRRAP